MLQITEAGRERVASIEFAKEMATCVREAKDGSLRGPDGLPVSEEIAGMALLAKVAATLCEKDKQSDLNEPKELEELSHFIDEHAEEVYFWADDFITALTERDTEDGPIN